MTWITLTPEAAGVMAGVMPVFALGWLIAAARDLRSVRKRLRRLTPSQHFRAWFGYVIAYATWLLFAMLELGLFLIANAPEPVVGAAAAVAWAAAFIFTVGATGNIVSRVSIAPPFNRAKESDEKHD